MSAGRTTTGLAGSGGAPNGVTTRCQCFQRAHPPTAATTIAATTATRHVGLDARDERLTACPDCCATAATPACPLVTASPHRKQVTRPDPSAGTAFRRALQNG